MDKKEKRGEWVYLYGVMLLMSFALTAGGSGFFKLMVQPLVILGIVGFLLLAWLLIGWNKWTLVISSSVVVGTGIVGCIGL
ncbi:MAG: hypothetical protein ACRCWY_12720, partial [Cellulosilyticaceae bacterium]